MNLGLEGKRALVQGGSAGLGKAIARALVDEGAKVAICARHADRVAAAKVELKASLGVVCDLASPGAARGLIAEVLEQLGGLDILVCNTGGPPKGRFDELQTSHWQEAYQNLWLSAVESIQGALPGMRQRRWGRVLLVTSVAAREPMPALTLSNGLRAGLLGLAKSLSREVAGEGITVNCLLPGYTDTERLRELKVPLEKMTSLIPAARLGQPEELAALAAFLASEKAGYLTGQTIAVDGGYLQGH